MHGIDKDLENLAKETRYNRKTAREIIDEEQRQMEEELKAIRDKYGAFKGNQG